MAEQKEIDELMRLFAENRPQQKETWQRHSVSENEGMLGVLLYLYRKDETVTAGMISRDMHITTGRVSVLIKKMSDKGLIIRENGKKDARITEIRMSEKGYREIQKMEKKRNDQMSELIDQVGMERLKEFIEIQREVWTILTPLTLDE